MSNFDKAIKDIIQKALDDLAHDIQLAALREEVAEELESVIDTEDSKEEHE